MDQLHAVYPSEPKTRVVFEETLELIRRTYRSRNKAKLLAILLDLKRFPFDDSYVQFLRADRTALRRNPRTGDRICQALYTMGLDKVLEGVTAPIVPNRRRGAQFKQWVQRHFPHLGVEEFRASCEGIVFLAASEKFLRDHANANFGAGLKKRPDFIAKVGKRHVVGEAKVLSAEGGEQRSGFEDAVTVAAHPAGKAVKVSVLDGIVWLESGSGFYQFIENSSLNIFSALLLKEFLESLR